MKTTTLLPAIRSRVGDWNFYVTTLTFEEVSSLIKAPDEIHERKQLSDWIQREAIETHAEAIAEYILKTPQRFLGSLIVGVYGSSPDWNPLKVRIPEYEEVTEAQLERIEGSLGLLHLFGTEKLFAIDGQHRVVGIKKALQGDPDNEILKGDSVSAIFVAHDPNTADGKARTRRLFTTVNKRAKTISKSQTIALDEDNGFAIVTRRLIDEYPLFADEQKRVLYSSTGAIPISETRAITSIVGLAEIVKDLYSERVSFDQERPLEEALNNHLELCANFFDTLIVNVPEYSDVFSKGNGQPGDYRTETKNHLLFRPVGQRAFARAVQLLLSRNMTMEDAIGILLKVDLNLLSDCWHHILWNPVGKTMIMGTLVVAEAQLLCLAGQSPRNSSSNKKLTKLLDSVAKMKVETE